MTWDLLMLLAWAPFTTSPWLALIPFSSSQGQNFKVAISQTERTTHGHKDNFLFVNRLWEAQNTASAFSHEGDLKEHLLNPNSMVLAETGVSVVPMVLQGHHKDLLAWQLSDRLSAFQCPALQRTDCPSH